MPLFWLRIGLKLLGMLAQSLLTSDRRAMLQELVFIIIDEDELLMERSPFIDLPFYCIVK